ncbi:MAG: Elongation factor P [Candidatus Beckwithbacteria bacterium GW2011_GWB1_47_15]|uniref:Elongation factor P n=1 Tax=Candidatus Beckwithbacteria bacterium GW2011_GWB1_47_15 TaxID=1618371 RepID=A0A0G1RVP5_9BACT|nr:MAG: efp, elongation factor P, elongation factor P [Candidatus Beckwithbacteria bacterium GW2011_GWC1_49_16]KKU35304.1 MAG: Elongation factor P [Candidatus Beckwithbacteria bacterium GW2011_GWA1_46_30]KKU61399.1 MAG: Elongation factor P [Candidatus Beckwithbacteria bacterium GW2011_GWB1_47_15]KKU71806.1 MAG: Elongation factor P [Candidatus Beckwithbacteria bacterium GW2011_GWA2_47_25]KKW03039.1 MAG: Elongation factor P [Candidatus Beckwithbacteria bacterium GW2011_GWC2_49_11]OGD48752.1 MAG:
MINVNQLRNGTAFEVEGTPFLVLKYEFTKMGRGTGNIKVKVKNLNTGAVTTKTFITGNKVEEINLTRKKMQFLYQAGDQAVFMDATTFDQVELEAELIKEERAYLTEGLVVEVLFWEEKPLSIQLPVKIEYEIKETGPGEKGDSATNLYKPAVLANGFKVKVPLFVKTGDKIRVDTRTGEYIERISN